LKGSIKNNRVEILHLHHVTISISTILLLNTIKFEFVPACGEERAKKCKCKVPGRGWIWASINHLQDYKIYGTMIKMFKSKFMSNLQQPPRNNPWPTNPANRNFKTQFHRRLTFSKPRLETKHNFYLVKNNLCACKCFFKETMDVLIK
jgi:hypothetical protein